MIQTLQSLSITEGSIQLRKYRKQHEKENPAEYEEQDETGFDSDDSERAPAAQGDIHGNKTCLLYKPHHREHAARILADDRRTPD